ncbi:MAG TPA: hypothetical protein DCL77_11225 [Prolixibacteraceae bacterium]|jgi:plasmid stabilization system protein ParE|nr:hypothetical protein [Prolixibacteraceae bacterium]
MALTVEWSEDANESFERILDYLQSQWGLKVVRAFVRKTYEFLDLLVAFPEIGSVENSERQIRGFVLVKQITVFYIRKNDSIVLLNFYDNRQKPTSKRR